MFADWLSAGGTDVKRRSESGEQDEKRSLVFTIFGWPEDCRS